MELQVMHSIDLVSIVVPVYRDGARAVAAAASMLGQALPDGVGIQVVVVDDGSDDDTPNLLLGRSDDRIKVVRLPYNRGRSAARNAGAAQAHGDVLLFMDCDCLPADRNLINAHLQAWDADVAASLGAVVGNGDGFWARYQAAASERRARQHAEGIHYSGSSQNLMVSRAKFNDCGGFDEAYRTYGFEDRDLQIRLGRTGRITWAAEAVVRHMDELDLPAVCRKMTEAGGPAAVLFSRRHPAAYQVLGYAALDARLHTWLRHPAWLLRNQIGRIANYADRIIAARHAPYSLKSALVRALTGLSYLAGTAQEN
jgi:glycosyltransferase involved in cell wall biosynthesis